MTPDQINEHITTITRIETQLLEAGHQATRDGDTTLATLHYEARMVARPLRLQLQLTLATLKARTTKPPDTP